MANGNLPFQTRTFRPGSFGFGRGRPNPLAVGVGSFLQILSQLILDRQQREAQQAEQAAQRESQRLAGQEQDFRSLTSQVPGAISLEQLAGLEAEAGAALPPPTDPSMVLPEGGPGAGMTAPVPMPDLSGRQRSSRLQEQVGQRRQEIQQQLSEQERQSIFEQAVKFIEGGIAETPEQATEMAGGVVRGEEGAQQKTLGTLAKRQQQERQTAETEAKRTRQEQEFERQGEMLQRERTGLLNVRTRQEIEQARRQLEEGDEDQPVTIENALAILRFHNTAADDARNVALQMTEQERVAAAKELGVKIPTRLMGLAEGDPRFDQFVRALRDQMLQDAGLTQDILRRAAGVVSKSLEGVEVGEAQPEEIQKETETPEGEFSDEELRGILADPRYQDSEQRQEVLSTLSPSERRRLEALRGGG